MTFDIDAFNDCLDEIETFLGYLKGNELAGQYLVQVTPEVQREGAYQSVSDECTTPCPHEEYKVAFDIIVPTNDGTVDWDIAGKIAAGATESWEKGPRWAAGIAEQARDITQRITTPDATALHDASITMARSVGWLERMIFVADRFPPEIGLPDDYNRFEGDWAGLRNLLNRWHGSAADEFRTVYDSLGASLKSYWIGSRCVTAEVAAAATVIRATQEGVLNTVRDVRDNLKAQLEKWRDTRQPPQDGSEFPTWILDLLTVWKIVKAARLAQLIVTNIDDFQKYIKDVFVEVVMGAAGGIAKGDMGKKEPFKAATADEVLTILHQSLGGSYRDKMWEPLSELADTANTHELRANDLAHEGTARWYPTVLPENATLHRPGDKYPN